MRRPTVLSLPLQLVLVPAYTETYITLTGRTPIVTKMIVDEMSVDEMSAGKMTYFPLDEVNGNVAQR
jgi:hypothetical protein